MFSFCTGSLHTGNLVIDNNVCRLLELENQVVGLPTQLRPFMINHRKINSIEAIDVYSFGHVLYEMIFQRRLTTDTCTEFPPECPPLSSKWVFFVCVQGIEIVLSSYFFLSFSFSFFLSTSYSSYSDSC